MRHLIEALLVALILSFSAVAQVNYPDHVGNRWILRSTDQLDTRITQITGEELLGTQVVRVLESRTNDGEPDRMYIASSPDGIRLYRSEVQLADLQLIFDYNPPQMFIPFPLALDTAWTVFGETLVAGDIVSVVTQAQVVAIEDVTVPAGHFQDVFKIQQDIELTFALGQLAFQRFIWFAPSIGIVKEVSISEVEFELIEYHLIEEGSTSVEPFMRLPGVWAALKQSTLQ